MSVLRILNIPRKTYLLNRIIWIVWCYCFSESTNILQLLYCSNGKTVFFPNSTLVHGRSYFTILPVMIFHEAIIAPQSLLLCVSVSLQRGAEKSLVSFCQMERHTHKHTHTQVWVGVSAPVSSFSEQRHDVCVTCLFCKAEITLGQCVWMCAYLKEQERVGDWQREWGRGLSTSCWKFNTCFFFCLLVSRTLRLHKVSLLCSLSLCHITAHFCFLHSL